MKYFSVEQVADSYKRLQQCTDEKFWGIMSILVGLPSSVVSNVCYPVQCSKISSFLENLFRFGNKKSYNGEDVLYVMFSSFWKKSVLDFFLKRKPFLYDLLVWSHRNIALPDECDNSMLVSLFIEKFHLSLSDLSYFVEDDVIEFSYSENLYNESDFLSRIGINTLNVNKTLKMNGTLVEANPGELSRGPFVQPLYAALSTINCLLISPVDLSVFYNYNSCTSNAVNQMINNSPSFTSSTHLSLLTAIRTKPFILLAGISGTGKSRIVRKLAQATTTKELQEYRGSDFETDRWQIHNPENFEIIQVKPNWHNSMDVLGYLSNIPSPHYVLTPLVNFIIKAWKHKDIPFFLCLDEMNLAPVEEYFAEFLSAIESRSVDGNGDYWTDALVKPFRDFGQEVYNNIMPLITRINPDAKRFADHGLTLPPNLIVIGTVNMDETTFSFSRKVLDRAMSIEMNEVDYDSYISGNTDDGIKAISGIEKLSQLLIDRHIEAKEFVSGMSDAQNVIDYLKKINILLEGTPFKLGYRAANEALIYVKSAQEFGCDDFRKSLDEFTLMKILSRMEGDEQKLAITDSEFDNEKLSKAGVDPEKAKEHDGLSILSCLWEIIENNLGADTKSVDKIKSMISQLRRDHFVSYWN